MKTKIVFGLVAGMAMLFTACSESTDGIDESLVDMKSSELAGTCDSCDFSAVLNQDEIDGLLWMYEEEKMAHDVYVYFFDLFGMPVFNNIAASEANHMASVLYLLEGYEIEFTKAEGDGVFNNPDITALYDWLIAAGTDSMAALAKGALIEETDINDLIAALAATDVENILRVYTNLKSGSESHLRAFVNTLTSLGGTYEPQLLDADYFAAILATQNGKRGQGKGQGNGQGNKGTNGKGTQSGSGNANQNGNNGTGSNGSNGTGICDGTGTTSSGQNGNSGSSGNSNGKGK
ncbi:DUF2202 domain-containing protein [Maribellus sediminis]|uniref:DUF2202 domain-containing protein n=1 Tax=Maribellus sediminis TaxID=2696285 RepID=UPI00143071AB|nr:DUF2202 domain-containing protein [Maribellus sediminis]